MWVTSSEGHISQSRKDTSTMPWKKYLHGMTTYSKWLLFEAMNDGLGWFVVLEYIPEPNFGSGCGFLF